jgi:hypothetical protein
MLRDVTGLPVSTAAVTLSSAGVSPSLPSDHEEGSEMFSVNFGELLPNYTALLPRIFSPMLKETYFDLFMLCAV